MSGPESSAQASVPPRAEKRPHEFTLHGETHHDDYAWLRERDDPRVIAHLEAENAYTESETRDVAPLRERLYEEMLSRIQQTDLSVPYRKGGFLYFTRTEEGKQYPIHCRRPVDAPDAEQVVLDLNVLAEGHAYMAVGDFEVSPDGRLLAYSTDDTGYRQYRLHLKRLDTGEALALTAERVTSVAWTSDHRALYYTQEDEVTKRSHRLYRHALAEPEPELEHEEPDERFGVEVGRTRSGEWLVYAIASHTASELRVLPASGAEREWTMVAAREPEREYSLDHRGDDFWILTNDRGRNFRLVRAPVASFDPTRWIEVVPHRDDVMLTRVDCFAGHVVLGEREHGLPQLTVIEPEAGRSRRVEFPEVAYTVGSATNAEYDTPLYRYTYESFLTPLSVYDLEIASLGSTLLKRTPVLGDWDPERYAMERVAVRAADGAEIPMTLVHRREYQRDGRAPCLLYGYGAYGISSNVTFSSSRFSLLDRGVLYAVAHVRGGGERGKTWHDQGRMQHKMNTFTDFIACAELLGRERYAAPDRIVILGGSAGGLLVGAVVNLRPDLFAGAVAKVPFVDVINTMLDETLPLTIGEFEEWGNPRVADDYARMRRYSPYENLGAAPHPAMLLRTSLNDSQVGYWEAAKYAAKLRAIGARNRPVLLHCNMGAGHGGSSGRYDALRELAFEYAWILRTLGAAT